MTRRGTPLPYWFTADDLDPHAPRVRVLLVAGLDGDPRSVRVVREWLRWFAEQPLDSPVRQRLLVSAIPCLQPDLLASRNEAREEPSSSVPLRFPPEGPAYGSDSPESAYLWRWLGQFAPDLVVHVTTSDDPRPSATTLVWQSATENRRAGYSSELRRALRESCIALNVGDSPRGTPTSPSQSQAPDSQAPDPQAPEDQRPRDLLTALASSPPCDMGLIPGLRVSLSGQLSDLPSRTLASLADALVSTRFPHPSPARVEWQRRVARSPRDLASELARVYGHALPQVEYIPAVAMVGRLQLATLTGDPTVLPDLERIVAPYVTAQRDSTPKSGSGQSGHLVFAALADAVDGDRKAVYVPLVRRAADQAFDAEGKALDAMPFHSEMSDAVFMGGPILAAAWRLTGDNRYADACLRNTRFIQQLNRRTDGLYRHSPLDESAWGRGNGFPALGLALILTELGDNHPAREELVNAHRAHLTALLRFQDASGCWHQVIDHPESYREFSATCMITFAMMRGVRLGWLDHATYHQAIESGWRAILARVGNSGQLIDVCTGTGKQRTLRDYYDREAILGRDPRGGAMALLAAVEYLRYSTKSPQ